MPHRDLLIVEDHDSTRLALAGIFRKLGCEVRTAATVAEGLASLDPPPDCAVIDLMLPDGDGEAVVREIRRLRLPTCVVVCTGVGDAGRLAAVRGLSVKSILLKPVQYQAVAAACNLALR